MKIQLVKNTSTKDINSDQMADLIFRYGIAGETYNNYGQVIYIFSRNRKRIHSILISRES